MCGTPSEILLSESWRCHGSYITMSLERGGKHHPWYHSLSCVILVTFVAITVFMQFSTCFFSLSWAFLCCSSASQPWHLIATWEYTPYEMNRLGTRGSKVDIFVKKILTWWQPPTYLVSNDRLVLILCGHALPACPTERFSDLLLRGRRGQSIESNIGGAGMGRLAHADGLDI